MDDYEDEQFEQSYCVDDRNEFVDNTSQNPELQQCDICQRKFHPERIVKHISVCEKAQQKNAERERLLKRKQQQKLEQTKKLEQKEVKNKTVNNWRDQHKQFQEMISHNRKVQSDDDPCGIKTPDIVVNSHYIFCESCQRNFAPNVADRHIPKCREIKAKPKPPKKNPLQELKRTQQLSTASTTNQTEEQTKQSFRPQSLMKTAEVQKRQLPEIKKAIYTGFGFMDCQTRATALSDTECPHCMRKFNTKAALRHIPICEKLTSKEQFKFKLKGRTSVPVQKNKESVLPVILNQQPQMKKILLSNEIPGQSKFCTQCGTKLLCGHKYCGGCGYKRENE